MSAGMFNGRLFRWRLQLAGREGLPMKKFLLAVGLLSIAGTALAAGKPCDELKSELDAKLQSKGVTSYTLEVVEKGSAAGKQVVGTCEGGTKEIVYQRG
ncbi:hypothetical protein PSPTOT1_2928 [Pseudomonas syringae pv. tomato T1]|uniref:DUF1161 domain-containing protein n=1 Tax=Pseudomonas syringae pv. maculicola TaxID=59511 RepID=A0A0P9TAD1_PSEYM|nr:hypothetical protein PSPTOT1_2928 [Pseudomonas syringae pv. tomato T1]KPX70774.1 hypothetical protein ALO84_100165 [Pseudomonas syringae pv. maculicola]RMM17821.1 hypothetical protein ALQ83_01479 [Pseudomonas syringae pv. berberidis]RMM01942.1 hypothetical protein APX70_05023 [Pseudomonas syringae pv. maculicola]RMP59008.1 hypothetical protein ALQ19_01591 [Pseudomonas syringae pv. berberidis]